MNAPRAAHAARFHLFYDPELARAIHGALAPETRADVPKTTSTTTLADAGVLVDVAAEDLPSLRAAVNSWLRWADAAERAARLAR